MGDGTGKVVRALEHVDADTVVTGASFSTVKGPKNSAAPVGYVKVLLPWTWLDPVVHSVFGL